MIHIDDPQKPEVEDTGFVPPTLHNLKKEEIKSGDVYIGRGPKTAKVAIDGLDGYYGNPFRMGCTGWPQRCISRKKVVASYENYARAKLTKEPEFARRVKDLAGKRLFCSCAPLPCHGDVLVKLCAELNLSEPSIHEEMLGRISFEAVTIE